VQIYPLAHVGLSQEAILCLKLGGPFPPLDFVHPPGGGPPHPIATPLQKFNVVACLLYIKAKIHYTSFPVTSPWRGQKSVVSVVSCRFPNSITTTCCNVANLLAVSLTSPQQVCNKLATSGKLRGNVCNGLWALLSSAGYSHRLKHYRPTISQCRIYSMSMYRIMQLGLGWLQQLTWSCWQSPHVRMKHFHRSLVMGRTL